MESDVRDSEPSERREWSAEWFDLRRDVHCPMCQEGRPEDNGFGARFLSGRVSDAYLQRAAIQRGYTVVIWGGRHVAEPTELTTDEAISYWQDVLDVARILETHFEPVKLNLWTAGNGLPHLHTHVIPRFLDDPAPEGPLAYPNALAEPFPEEALIGDLAALRALAPSVD
jgi:diadenosine tetraphosphate (Ap4A) HIT family hydrolase